MNRHLSTRARWIALATLSVFAAIAPQASADTALPVWGCRASAAYVELPSITGTTRVEPILANGFPKTGAAGNNEQCVNAEAGAPNVFLPAGPTVAEPLIELDGAFARTVINASAGSNPPLGNARDQDVFAEGGVTDPLRIIVAGITIQLDSVNAEARADCLGTLATFSGTSTILNLRINGLSIPLLNGVPQIPIALQPLVEVAVNQQLTSGTVGVDRSLTQQALRITLLGVPLAGTALATVVIGEAKVSQRGDTCAAAPPPPTCLGGQIPQNPGGVPLVCVRPPCPSSPPSTEINGVCVVTVSPPCGAGTTPSNGTCIATPVTCPAATVKEPTSGACVLVVQRPCPTGSTADPATRVCVLRVAGSDTVSGENGRIGNANGPVATCGRLTMRFVRGTRNLGTRFTSRFGNRTVTRGRLVTCGSNPRPIVRARIDVVHVFGGKRRIKTGLRSRADGLLTLILPIDLRTRNIEYGYRPNLNTSRVTSRVTLRLTVKNKAGRTLR